MQTRDLTAVFVILAMAAGFATASSATDSECISGCETPPPPPPEEEKGNNGWGNGIDGENPGTDKGNARQVSTKNNTDPAEYDADKVERFEGR